MFSKLYLIKRTQNNVMNMKLQIIYGIFISNGMLFDYLRNVYLSTNYHHLGPSGAFKLWLKANIIENIGKLNQLEYKTNYNNNNNKG